MRHGRDLNIYLQNSDKPIANATDTELDVSQDFIDACSPQSGRTNNKIPTTYDWSASTNCLVSSWSVAKTMMNYAINGTAITLKVKMSGVTCSGNAYVSNVRTNGSVNGLAKMSVSFVGSGALSVMNSVDGVDV